MESIGVYLSVVIVLLTFVICKLVGFIRSYKKFCTYFENTPGPSEYHWFYGNAYKLAHMKTSQERLNQFIEWGRMYTRYFRIWFNPSKPILFLCHPETIKILFKSTEPKNISFGGGYRHLLPWLGKGLLIADGPRWARARRLLTPAFHFDVLRPYLAIYNKSAEAMIDQVAKYADIGDSLELFQTISSCTLDIVLRCAFSYETDCQQDGHVHPYVQAVTEIARTLDERTRNFLLHPDLIFYLTSRGRKFKKNCNYVHSVAENIINERRKALAEGRATPREYPDFLDILLLARDENGVSLSDAEIRNEVDTFLFEGHDTTASAISWILYSLAEHPEYQRKCQAEIDEVLKHKDNKCIEWNDLPELEYLTMCIKEGMRLHSPVPGVGRATSREITIDGITYPPDTVMILHIFLLHHNPDVWKDPDVCDPERFSKENIDKIGPFDFCPFAAGPRNCIGQNFAMNEEKVVIARFLHQYNIELDKSHKTEKEPAVVMRASDGIRVLIKRRL